MSKPVCVLLGVLIAIQSLSAVHGAPNYGYGGYGYGGCGYGGYGYGGYGVGVVEEIVEPVIPVSGGLVDTRSFVDSYFPGSSYCGYGTYGPAYGGRGYPLEVFGGYGGLRGFGGGYYY